MKKIILSLVALSTLTLVACGPSKTYTTIETAQKTAMADLDTVTVTSSINTIVDSWTTACTEATTANGAAKEDEAQKITDLNTALQAKVTAKSDSLTQILIQQMTLIEDISEPAEVESTPAK
ncbi:MAG: hypothetical protein RSF93_03095 [Mucinivorans sp.]